MSNLTANHTATPTAWVIAADHGRARLFYAPVPTAPLQEVQDLFNPVARQHESEIVSDRPGRIAKGLYGRTHAVSQHESHKDRATEQFAGSVCKRLSQARIDGLMGRLYVIAEPGFLGMLRKHMDPATKSLVTSEISKDVTRHSAAELRALLPIQL